MIVTCKINEACILTMEKSEVHIETRDNATLTMEHMLVMHTKMHGLYQTWVHK